MLKCLLVRMTGMSVEMIQTPVYNLYKCIIPPSHMGKFIGIFGRLCISISPGAVRCAA